MPKVWEPDVPLVVARRCGMDDEILIRPFDGIAYMRADIHGRKQKSLDFDRYHLGNRR